MRKLTGLVVAMGLVVGLVAGCGAPSKQNMVSKLQTEAEKLDATNYQSTALMTVQMDNGSQTYYIKTNYEAPDVYQISLGDGNKHINQIIVRNKNGMFIVSPSLQKVFRFNGNWAQNQGHIYLYDQILQQISDSKDVKMSKQGNDYSFVMPITPQNDVVAKQRVDISAISLEPKQVILYDKEDKAVVTLKYTSFKRNVKFTDVTFDPHKLATQADAKTTIAAQTNFGYIEPSQTLGDKLDILQPGEADAALLHYTGAYTFTLAENRPAAGVTGLPNTELVDLYGVPAMYSGFDKAHQLLWTHDGVEFSLTSSKLTLDQMKSVAISTFSQVGK